MNECTLLNNVMNGLNQETKLQNRPHGFEKPYGKIRSKGKYGSRVEIDSNRITSVS